MKLPLFVRVLMADALAAAKPPARPRRILQCRNCGGSGEVAPLVEVWTCPRCIKGRDLIGERDVAEIEANRRNLADWARLDVRGDE